MLGRGERRGDWLQFCLLNCTGCTAQGQMFDCVSEDELRAASTHRCSVWMPMSRMLYIAGPKDWQMVDRWCSLVETSMARWAATVAEDV
jgi:hypothetical protein